jgi:hypothetical protein
MVADVDSDACCTCGTAPPPPTDPDETPPPTDPDETPSPTVPDETPTPGTGDAGKYIFPIINCISSAYNSL